MNFFQHYNGTELIHSTKRDLSSIMVQLQNIFNSGKIFSDWTTMVLKNKFKKKEHKETMKLNTALK